MSIKAADTLEPNGDFALANAENINITIDGEEKKLSDYISSIESGKGKSISSITKTNTAGLVDTYSINYSDGSTADTFTVTNGAKGETGATGATGAKGDKGDTGETGAKGDKGDAFTYSDFTEEQLAALKGEKGDKGDTGATGATGATGPQGETGAKGETGDKGDTGEKGEKGDTGTSAHVATVSTTDDDGTQHVYIKTWEGDDDSSATLSADLMANANDIAAAIEEIMSSYTGTTTTTTSTES